MVDTEPVSAYAVYRNLVHVGNKKVNRVRRNRGRNKRKLSSTSSGSPGRVRQQKKLAKKDPVTSVKLKSRQTTSSGDVEGRTILNGNGENNTLSLLLPESLPSTSFNSSLRMNKVKKAQRTSKKSEQNKKAKAMNVSPSKGKKRWRKLKASDTSPKPSGVKKALPKKKNENYDSFVSGEENFAWLIHPATPADFFKTAWEKRPLHIKRHLSNYYSSLLSTEGIDKMLREHNIIYGKNLDITSYVDGKRETHNPVGRANASVVWDYYNNGCSVRLLNPQTFIDKVWKLCASLQDVFGCFVGANVYLTPPDSQGFAPHYDDIEAFILQLEGKKHWKLYAPLSSEECLPRFSSKNFSPSEIGEPILDVVLEAGDLLYFPRGVIHQGSTLPETHSLHITVSSYQRNTWGDFLEKLVPVALQAAIEEDPSYREGLPRDYLRYMGVAHSDFTSEGRNQFIEKIGNLMKKLCDFAGIDAAADQMGKQLMHDALPPALSLEEKGRTVFEDGDRLVKGVVTNKVGISPDTRIKLIRGNVLRLVTEEDSVRAYHCVENSREYHAADEPQFIELSDDLAPVLEFLIHSYPAFVSVDELPLDELTVKLLFVVELWEKGLVMTEQPLPPDAD
ncbi:ribosomal oxygenase 1-like [Ischnura elegans]|uniref:ribosomal oxygenase 1-like n=1 Tax=Ischnura elegans TaxID=197161 RepID=UPI001ED8B35C|nr:ribosomal oxygenase 1-like [Ischnura elegans]